jgi:hypothetical protein
LPDRPLHYVSLGVGTGDKDRRASSAFRLFTFVALVSALGISLWWWAHPREDWLQAPSTALALIAAVSGIPADRWAAEAQRRAGAVVAAPRTGPEHRDPARRPLPPGGAVDRSGLPAPNARRGRHRVHLRGVELPRDRELLRRLLAWRNTAEDFNRRLDITEIRLCIIENLSGDELSALRDMAREPRGYFALVGRRIGELREALDAAGGWTPPWPVRRVLAEPDRETTLREEAVDLTGRTRGALDARQHGLRGNLDVPDA